MVGQDGGLQSAMNTEFTMDNVIRLAIQCMASNGATGTFLFQDSGFPIHDSILVSPVFPDLATLSQWANANGYLYVKDMSNPFMGHYVSRCSLSVAPL